MLSKGHAYEQKAEHYLKSRGYCFRERNFHSRHGEIDLIMTYRSRLIFIEVRYRKSNLYGTAEESVNTIKQRKIILTAKYYISKHNLWHMDIQFDVVTISPDPKEKKTKINWLENAFCA